MTRTDTHHRRGSIYVVMLGTSLIVTTIGIAAILAARTMHTASQSIDNAHDALLISESALAMASQWIHDDTDWRSEPSGGVWVDAMPMGSGQVTIEVIDPIDGDITDSTFDPVTIKATATVGNTRQVTQVTLQPRVLAYDVLSRPGSGRGFLKIGTLSADVSGGKIGVTTPSAGGLSFVEPGLPLSDLPDPDLFDEYRDVSIPLPVATTTDGFGREVLQNTVVGPPGGTSIHPDYGVVYYLEAPAGAVIRNVRVRGTLLIKTSGSVHLENNLLLEPYHGQQPALMIEGIAQFNFDGGDGLLSEQALGVNFNPPDLPYMGQIDNDTDDVYPSRIDGLVHVTRFTFLRRKPVIHGTLISNNTIRAIGIPTPVEFTLKLDPDLSQRPPRGYQTSVGMAVDPGSWQRTVTTLALD